MNIIDNESPPGAWADEMKAAPWGYGQAQSSKVHNALTTLRDKSLWIEAEILEREITTLKRELEALRGNRR